MLFRLPYEMYERYDGYIGNGQSALLQAVRDSLKGTYQSSKIGADGQVVQIVFDDGITFEVLPTFINKNDSYTYPDSNNGGSWKVTNPKPEMEAIKTRNEECNGNLIPLCRMMRAWKSTWSVPIRSMLIDTLAYQFIDNWAYKDKSYMFYDWMCRDFFEFMKNQNEEKEYWLAPGSGQHVYGKGLFQYKAKRCYNIALEAIAHEGKKEYFSAKTKWREIFGTDCFPI